MALFCICRAFRSATTLYGQKHVMIHTELLRQIIPSLVTSVALHYPIAYIKSISFNLQNTVIAACFWHEPDVNHPRTLLIKNRNNHFGCMVFTSTVQIDDTEVEINGTDERGHQFVISIPYKRIMNRRVA